MLRSITSCAFFLFLSASAGPAQPEVNVDRVQTTCEVWGQIAGASSQVQEGLDIELAGRETSSKQKVHVSTKGNFEFEAVPAGDYRFRVKDRSGAVILDQMQSLTGKDDFVFLVIRDQQTVLVSKDTVSLAALRHKTPSRALEAYREARKAGAAGDIQKAIQRLQDALVIDPDFAEAHSDLAVRYAKMGQVEEGLQHAQIAFNLNPGLPEAGCNLAMFLVTLKQYKDAEIASRRMLDGGSYLPELHGVLAISLIGQRKNLDEALDHLRQAAAAFPYLMVLAAHAFMEIGRPELAVDQVKTYLQTSAHDCERKKLQAWVDSEQSQLASRVRP
jgi:tetratricopeptide (TPR) repeat protein